MSEEKIYYLRFELKIKTTANKDSIKNYLITKLQQEKQKGTILSGLWSVNEASPPPESGEI